MTYGRRSSAPATFNFKGEIPGLKEYLNRSDLLGSCSTKVQDAIVDRLHFRHFQRGETLIQSGNKASTLFILLKGKVQVISDTYEAVLAELGSGMIFGEIGAMFGVTRTASVVATSNGLVAVINKSVLEEVIKTDKILWNHIKGIAMSRYNLTGKVMKSKCIAYNELEREEILTKLDLFKNVPAEKIKKLSELIDAQEYKSDTIVDFFSTRSKHLLYLVKDGTLQLRYLNGETKTIGSGDIFKSYDDSLDFVKTLTDKTVLFIVDVQLATAIFSDNEELGEQLFGCFHLTDHVDANSSLTTALANHQMTDLNCIINPAQFSKRRRNSTPVFSDLGLQKGFCMTVRESIPYEVATASSRLINEDSDLKELLLNAGIHVPESIILLFQDRLNLTYLKNDLTDSLLLAIVSVLGDSVRAINLTDCQLLTSQGISAMWLRCPNLVKISLQGCWKLEDSSFSTLQRCACADTLKEINLAHCTRITPKMLNFINQGITKLDLSYCKNLDDRTWTDLIQFSQSIRSLSLKRCLGITDNSFEGTFGAQFGELEFLDLSECAFLTDSAASSILSAAPNLRTLNLSFATSLKGSFLLHFDSLPNLQVLHLSHLKDVVDESLCLRLKTVCVNLTELYLDGCLQVDDDALAHLENLTNLKRLSINDCPLVSLEYFEFLNLKYNN